MLASEQPPQASRAQFSPLVEEFFFERNSASSKNPHHTKNRFFDERRADINDPKGLYRRWAEWERQALLHDIDRDERNDKQRIDWILGYGVGFETTRPIEAKKVLAGEPLPGWAQGCRISPNGYIFPREFDALFPTPEDEERWRHIPDAETYNYVPNIGPTMMRILESLSSSITVGDRFFQSKLDFKMTPIIESVVSRPPARTSSIAWPDFQTHALHGYMLWLESLIRPYAMHAVPKEIANQTRDSYYGIQHPASPPFQEVGKIRRESGLCLCPEDRAARMTLAGFDRYLDLPCRFDPDSAEQAMFNPNPAYRLGRYDEWNWRHRPHAIMALHPPEWYRGTEYWQACQEFLEAERRDPWPKQTVSLEGNSVLRRRKTFALPLYALTAIIFYAVIQFMPTVHVGNVAPSAAFTTWLLTNFEALLPLAAALI
jgi:hypothetical protein